MAVIDIVHDRILIVDADPNGNIPGESGMRAIFGTIEYICKGGTVWGLDKPVVMQLTPFNASSGTLPTVGDGGIPIRAGYEFTVSNGGTIDNEVIEIGNVLRALIDSPSSTTIASNWRIIRNGFAGIPALIEVTATDFIIKLPDGTVVIEIGKPI